MLESGLYHYIIRQEGAVVQLNMLPLMVIVKMCLEFQLKITAVFD